MSNHHSRLTELDEFKKAGEYWLDKLSGELREIKLYRDFPAIQQDHYKKAAVKISLENNLKEKLLGFSKNNHLSLYIILLSAFKVLLSRYTGQTDIIVTSPLYNRANEKYNKYVALRDFIHPDLTFKELVMQTRDTVVEGYKNEHYSIDHLIELLDLEESFSLYRVVLSMESIHNKKYMLENIADSENELILSIDNESTPWQGEFIYNSALFKKETIRQLAGVYLSVLEQVSDDIDIKLHHIETMGEQEKNRVLLQFNNTGKFYPGPAIIHRLFENQVEKTPGNIAVSSSVETVNIYDEMKPGKINIHISYEQLNSQANQLAALIREKGCEPDQIAGLMVQHPLELAVGILGILKAGGAYLPVDHTYPTKVKKRLLIESNVRLLVSEEPLVGDLSGVLPSLEIIFLDEMDVSGYEVTNLPLINTPLDLAYVIYTSGTTGKSKGVLIQHEGVVNYILWRLETYRCTEADAALQLLSYCFDGFVSNFYTSLFSGGALYMVPGSKRMDADYIKEVIAEHGITNMSLVPGLYDMILNCTGKQDLKSLRFVVLAGEKSKPALLKKSREKFPAIQLVNEYGPTESTVTAAAFSGLDELTAAVIGKPVWNTNIYILDPMQQPVSLHFPGELYISGAGTARGYLNNPELTTEKFDHDLWDYPGSYALGSRLYKTGDLGRWLPGGNIEFLGRMDNQVKIRGFRIELEAIENRLLLHDEVKEAAAALKEDENKNTYLCAYIAVHRSGIFDNAYLMSAELSQFLSQTLPGYMIPSYFVRLEKLPLTVNGKLDRKALPLPGAVPANEEIIPPRDKTEEKLVEIWQELLGIKKESIGIDSDFFRLGGHSLKAAIMISQIHHELAVKIPLAEVFKMPTIRQLAEYLQESKEEKYQSIKAEEKKEYYALSSAQKRAYIIQQLNPGTSANANSLEAVVLEGNPDIKRLEETFDILIRRHESLRTSFVFIHDESMQRIHENPGFKIGYHVLFSSELEAGIEAMGMDFGKPFDLSRAPLLRAGLIKKDPLKKEHILMVEMHHIISDGMSHSILQQEFMQLYNGESLPALKFQYKDYSQWQQKQSKSGVIKQQEEYWLKQFAGEIPRLNLPVRYESREVRSAERSGADFILGKKQTQALKELAAQEQATLFMVLLTIYYIFLAKLSGQEDIVVGTMSAGRDRPDLQGIIGMFVNTLALRSYPAAEKTFIAFLKEVKQTTLEALENQDYQFEDLVDHVVSNRELNRNPLFDARFTLQNIEFRGIKIKDTRIMPYNKMIHRKDYGNVDLELSVVERRGTLHCHLKYNLQLLNEETIKTYVEYFKEITTVVIEDQDIRLKDISISYNLPDSEPGIYEEEQGDFVF